MHNQVKKSLEDLIIFCKKEEFKGYDPYDGLSSNLFQSLPLINQNRFARLIWIQMFKRSPINLRRIFGIRKNYNPKALGLFLSGYCALYKLEAKKEYMDEIHFFINKIFEVSSTGYSGVCWGYNFDWESRAFFQPKNTPTIVASSFIANSLLDAFDLISDRKLLNSARSTCNFILNDLNRTFDKKGNFAFSYSKLDNSVVYNASLLGSYLLARVYHHTKESILINEAQKSVSYCCEAQKADGSWSYGESKFHHWVDNFHTGYNLECISGYIKYSGDLSFEPNLNKGLTYYIDTFFSEQGISNYYNNSIYPIDIHSPAQFVITLAKTGRFHENQKLIEQVLKWTIEHMQSKNGYFYYQINKYFSSKIPYMRWSQAWMFYAMSTYLYKIK